LRIQLGALGALVAESARRSTNVYAHRENVPAGGASGYKLGSRSTGLAWGRAGVGSTDFGSADLGSAGMAGLIFCGLIAFACFKRGGLCATFFAVSESFVSNGML
jgi:hypothetical protein